MYCGGLYATSIAHKLFFISWSPFFHLNCAENNFESHSHLLPLPIQKQFCRAVASIQVVVKQRSVLVCAESSISRLQPGRTTPSCQWIPVCGFCKPIRIHSSSYASTPLMSLLFTFSLHSSDHIYCMYGAMLYIQNAFCLLQRKDTTVFWSF